ncbi:hypothetical protein [Pseudoduganella sp. OTU4001]|uniref:hypothetical protein n=1 Tax=Pseudoduganella sp. OTU4001 TaxID=3043854 RepID=UPI00313AB018
MHPYLRYRTRMARHSLRQFIASMVNSLEIIGLVFAPVVLGLMAFVSMPVMMAATRGAAMTLAAIAGQAVLVALPVVLLRKRLHPADAVAWERTLPVPPALGWQGDWLVAGRLVGWMAGICAVSAAIWLYQWPAWLRPVWGRALAALAASIALGWALAAAIVTARRLRLRHRGIPRSASAHGGADPGAADAARYAPRPLQPRYLALWHRLFWLPFWRAENKTGIQQCALLATALAGAVFWTTHALPLPRAALGLFTSAALMLLVDRGDKAVREQAAEIALPLAMWPLAQAPLLAAARTFTLLPAFVVLAVMAGLLTMLPGAAAGLRAGLAAAWLGFAAAAALAIVVLPAAPRGRVVLVTFSILLLTAIGSELWA